jgi:glycine betaine/proline transport system substrate-binding protein
MSRSVRIGHIALSFHEASAIEVEKILTAHGHAVERSAAPHEEMFKRLGQREIDILVSAWLPASHGGYLAPIEDQVRKLTVLYEPYCIWGVPDTYRRATLRAWRTFCACRLWRTWTG